MRIEYIESADQLAEVLRGLVEQGLTFRAYPKGAFWIVELLGGY